jgi:hypothetical protein
MFYVARHSAKSIAARALPFSVARTDAIVCAAAHRLPRGQYVPRRSWQKCRHERTDTLVAASCLTRTNDQYGVSISLQAAVVDLTYRAMGNSGPLIVAKPICLLAEPTGHRPCSTN